jgi:hypothetical protein
VAAQLKGVEVADEHALALRAGEAGLELDAGGLNPAEVGLGFPGQDARVDTTLVAFDKIDIGHVASPGAMRPRPQ